MAELEPGARGSYHQAIEMLPVEQVRAVGLHILEEPRGHPYGGNWRIKLAMGFFFVGTWEIGCVQEVACV